MSTNDLNKGMIPFNFNNTQVRVIQDKNNESLFVLADVCKVLGVANVTDVKNRLDDDEVQLIDLQALDSIEGIKNKDLVNVVTESGLYSVVLRSDKPQAKPFRKWITSEVLPSIRKTGSYTIEPVAAKPAKPSEISSTAKAMMSMAKAFGFSGNQAVLSADQATQKLIGVSPLSLLGNDLISEHKEPLLTASDIGVQLGGLSAIKVNLLLEEKELHTVAYIREDECIGCTKCIQACPVDAILGAAKHMHTVIASECTGCDLCIEPCPVDCIDMVPVDQGIAAWHWGAPQAVRLIATDSDQPHTGASAV